MTTQDLLTTAEVAEMLRISRRTLEGWRLGGRGPAWVRVGRRVVYRAAAVEEWLSANTTTAA